MAEERKVNIMSVELAVKRELAYRKKLAQLYPEDDWTKELLPLEVPSSTIMTSSFPSSANLSGPHSMNNQIPFPNPCLYPSSTPRIQGSGPCPTSDDASYPLSTLIAYLKRSPVQSQDPSHWSWPNMDITKASIHSITKEKTTANSFQCLPDQWPQSSHISNTTNFFCKVCQVSCSGPISFKQHIRGHKHKAMLTMQQPSRNAGGANKRSQLRCNLCNIWCSDEDGLELHLNGQKHGAKLQEVQLCQKGKASQQLWCELCQVPCSHEDTYRLHLKGKNHAANLQALGINSRAM